VVKRIAAVRLALLVTLLLSAACNAILAIDEHKLTSPDAASDAGATDPDVRFDVDSGSLVPRDGSADAPGLDAPSDRRDTDAHEGGSSGADASDAADAGATTPDARDDGNTGVDSGDGGSSTGDGGSTGGDGGDAGGRIVVLRGTISTVKLAPAAAGNVRLVDHGIAVPWKSCNASNCVSGGMAP